MKLIIININSLILISYKVFVFDRLERKTWRIKSASRQEQCSATSKGTLKNSSENKIFLICMPFNPILIF